MACPKKFLCAIPIGFVGGLFMLMALVRFQLGVPTASSAWISELIERKNHAAVVISQPKLLLLGGSATLFGIKASVLEAELGVPVVNGGLHAGLGMACILREGKKLLRTGDTVVLFPEYELLNFGEKNRREWAAITYLDFMLSRDSEHYLELPIADQLEIALMTPADRLWNGIKVRWFPEPLTSGSDYNPYDASSIDSRGDMTGHLAIRRPDNTADRDQRVCEVFREGLTLDEEGFMLISEFKRWADLNRVRVLAGFPNMVHRAAYENSMVDGIERQLVSFYAMQGIGVVGGLGETLMPADDFFDTIYHPTEETSIRISKRLARQMRPIVVAKYE